MYLSIARYFWFWKYIILFLLLFKNGDLIEHINIGKEVIIKWFKQIVLGLKELYRHKSNYIDFKTGYDFNFMLKS